MSRSSAAPDGAGALLRSPVVGVAHRRRGLTRAVEARLTRRPVPAGGVPSSSSSRPPAPSASPRSDPVGRRSRIGDRMSRGGEVVGEVVGEVAGEVVGEVVREVAAGEVAAGEVVAAAADVEGDPAGATPARTVPGDHHLGVVVRVGDGVLEQGVHGRDELAALAHHGHGGEGSCRTISMPRWSAVARTRSMASAMTRLTRTGSRWGASSDSIRERSSRSSMMRLDPEGLVVDATGQPLGHLGVRLGDQRLGQQTRARPSASSARGSRWPRSRGGSPRAGAARRCPQSAR